MTNATPAGGQSNLIESGLTDQPDTRETATACGYCASATCAQEELRRTEGDLAVTVAEASRARTEADEWRDKAYFETGRASAAIAERDVARAAIQRVRELCDEAEADAAVVAKPFRPTVRASMLTTSEVRRALDPEAGQETER